MWEDSTIEEERDNLETGGTGNANNLCPIITACHVALLQEAFLTLGWNCVNYAPPDNCTFALKYKVKSC